MRVGFRDVSERDTSGRLVRQRRQHIAITNDDFPVGHGGQNFTLQMLGSICGKQQSKRVRRKRSKLSAQNLTNELPDGFVGGLCGFVRRKTRRR